MSSKNEEQGAQAVEYCNGIATKTHNAQIKAEAFGVKVEDFSYSIKDFDRELKAAVKNLNSISEKVLVLRVRAERECFVALCEVVIAAIRYDFISEGFSDDAQYIDFDVFPESDAKEVYAAALSDLSSVSDQIRRLGFDVSISGSEHDYLCLNVSRVSEGV